MTAMERIRYCDLGRMDYAACWALQRRLFDTLAARKSGRSATAAPADRSEPSAHAAEQPSAATAEQPSAATLTEGDAGILLAVEHPPVYTLGKSGDARNLLVAPERLEALGATFFHIDRGGDITFHGPGQLVGYPILDLDRLGLGLRAYVDALEEAVIRTVGRFGIEAGRVAGASGVWLGRGVTPHGTGILRKICALGVRASRAVTMHGFALNVSTDLEWFSRINPCGFADRGVTSIARETQQHITMDDVKEEIVRNLGEILNVKIYK